MTSTHFPPGRLAGRLRETYCVPIAAFLNSPPRVSEVWVPLSHFRDEETVASGV